MDQPSRYGTRRTGTIAWKPGSVVSTNSAGPSTAIATDRRRDTLFFDNFIQKNRAEKFGTTQSPEGLSRMKRPRSVNSSAKR